MRELLAASVHLVKSKSITEFNSQWKGDSHDGEGHAFSCRFHLRLIFMPHGSEGRWRRRPGHARHDQGDIHDLDKNLVAVHSGGVPDESRRTRYKDKPVHL